MASGPSAWGRAMTVSPPVQPGQVIAGKYLIEAPLGRGGMSIVYSALHLVLGQRVALKILAPKPPAEPSMRVRFLREAQAAARIRGDHVARVLDVGSLADGTPFMVLEYLEGEDLGLVLHRWGRLPVPFAVELVVQACVAVAEAHSLGMVHRDLKPSNLFLTRGPDGQPHVKVLDFGVSKMPIDLRA